MKATQQGWYLEMNKKEGGYFLVSAVVMILFLTALGTAIAALVGVQYQHTRRESFDQNAQLVAEAGIEQSVNQLNANDAFAGYTSPQTFFNNSTQGYGTFTSTVTTNADGTSRTIISIGQVYRSSTSTTPYITRKIKVTAVGTGSSGYSVFSGPGGIILSGSANITNSQVYTSGGISMSGHARIGTYANPVQVDVANDQCPSGSSPGPTYPQVCSDGTQPLTFTGNATIYGSVCATGQTSSGNVQGGSTGSGLKPGCTTPVYSPPSYNRQAQISAVTTTASGNDNTYICKNSPFTRSWPSNLELTGDVTIGSSCTVTVTGNVYITGNLNIGGSSQFIVSSAAGATRPVIIVDGTITIGGSSSMVANASGTGIEFISFESTAPCNPNCTTVTGNDLKNSQSLQTISVGGSAKVPGMIFDAYWSEVTLGGSGSMGAAAGQTVNLSGAGTIVFGQTLSSGSKTWSITSYQPIY